mgnify:FL=1
MAITAASQTSEFGGFIRPERAAAIFDEAARASVVQRLGRQIPLGASGVEIPIVTGKMSAGWVSEAGQKPASKGGLGLLTMAPKKLASIAVVSAEVVRANPGGYIDQLRGQIAEAFAIAFDYAALHDLGPDGTGTGPFTTYLDQTTKSVEIGTGTTIHNDFTAALGLLVADGKKLNGFALNDTMEPLILDAVDGNDRPIYIDTPLAETTSAARPGRLLGRPSFMGEGVATPTGTSVIGYAGDWSKVAWGNVGGITYDVSTQATVTINGALTSLWEHNLVAIRAEAEYGFICGDVASFVKLTNAA